MDPRNSRFCVVVAGLDHERVAFPSGARVAGILADLRGDVRPAVERHDARRVVAQLGEDHDVVRRLEDLVDVVVRRRHHGRPLVGPQVAAFGQRPDLVAVEGVGARPQGAHGGGARRRLRREGREPAVARIGDQRRPPARQSLRYRRAQPDLVVVVDVVALFARAVALVLVALELLLVVDFDEGEDFARGRIDARGRERVLQPGPLLLREELLVGQMVGPLQRREGLGGPVALEIRLPVRQARHGPLLRGDGRSREDYRNDSGYGGQCGALHGILPCSINSGAAWVMIAQNRLLLQLRSAPAWEHCAAAGFAAR